MHGSSKTHWDVPSPGLGEQKYPFGHHLLLHGLTFSHTGCLFPSSAHTWFPPSSLAQKSATVIDEVVSLPCERVSTVTLLHLLGRQCTNAPTASHLLKPSHLNLSHGFGRLTQLCDPCALISQIRSLDSHRRVFARLQASLILVHVAEPSTSSHIFPVAHVRFVHTLPILWHCPIPPLSTHRYPDAQLTKSHGAATWHTARFSSEMPHT